VEWTDCDVWKKGKKKEIQSPLRSRRTESGRNGREHGGLRAKEREQADWDEAG